MELWIISEHDDLTASIRAALTRLSIDCPTSHVLSCCCAGAPAMEAGPGRQIVFVAARSLAAHHFDLLHALRSGGSQQIALVSSVTDHATVLKAIRAGATDVLNADGKLDDEIAEYVSRVRTEGGQGSAKARLITVVPCHALGDGNILSVNLAAVVAKRAGSCCLIDIHLRGGDLALLLKATARHTVLDLLKQRRPIDQAMFEQALTRHDSGIRLLAGPPLFSDLRGIEPQVCQRLFSLAQASDPFVVVNSEDAGHAEQIKALAMSDDVVITLRPDVVSLHRAKQFVEFMTRNHIGNDHIHAVSMGAGYSGELPIKALRSVLDVPSIHTVPDDPAAITRSVNVGNPLVLETPRSKTSKAIIQFAESLIGRSEVTRAAMPPATALAKAATFLAANTLTWVK